MSKYIIFVRTWGVLCSHLDGKKVLKSQSCGRNSKKENQMGNQMKETISAK